MRKDKDPLGTRMKTFYEDVTRNKLPGRTNTIIRLDGKAFHTFTRGCKKPFDASLTDALEETTRFLCEKIQGCKLGYHQSDEISLLLTDYDTLTTSAWYDRNIQKIASVSASYATAVFNQIWQHTHPGASLAFFDSRVFTIPETQEVINYFYWRRLDATRNSVSAVAQSHFSQKALNGKGVASQKDMVAEKGDPWEKYEDRFRFGTFTVGRTHEVEIEFPPMVKVEAPVTSWTSVQKVKKKVWETFPAEEKDIWKLIEEKENV